MKQVHTIVVGSANQVKVEAVISGFDVVNSYPNCRVYGHNVSSQVHHQPIGDDETRLGASNRAQAAWNLMTDQEREEGLSIGLEGGVVFYQRQWWLINWGALYDGRQLYYSCGPILRLPCSFGPSFLKGEELADIIARYLDKDEGKIFSRNKGGVVELLSGGLMTRHSMFSELTCALRGQWLASENISLMESKMS